MSPILDDVIARSRRGEPAAIPSVCSAHPEVIEASLRLGAIAAAAIMGDNSSPKTG